MARSPIAEVLAEHAPHLMSLEGVVAVGEGVAHGQPCIVVYIDDQGYADVPAEVAGHPVEVRRSGPIRAQ